MPPRALRPAAAATAASAPAAAARSSAASLVVDAAVRGGDCRCRSVAPTAAAAVPRVLTALLLRRPTAIAVVTAVFSKPQQL